SLVDAYVDEASRRIARAGGGHVQERVRALREWGELLRGLETAAPQRNLKVLGGQVLLQEQAADSSAARWYLFGDEDEPAAGSSYRRPRRSSTCVAVGFS